jgi:hypothetical protein
VLDKDREKNMMNGVIKKLGFDPEKPLMILTYGTTYGKQIGNSYIWTTNRLPLIDLLTKSEKWEFLFLMDDTGAATGSSSLTYKVYEKNNKYYCFDEGIHYIKVVSKEAVDIFKKALDEYIEKQKLLQEEKEKKEQEAKNKMRF